MNRLVLAALIVFAVASLGGLALATVRGFAAWRAFRGFRRVTEPLLTETEAKLAGIERRTAAASAQAARLQRARAQLEESLAAAAVLSTAAAEAWSTVRGVRSLLPRK